MLRVITDLRNMVTGHPYWTAFVSVPLALAGVGTLLIVVGLLFADDGAGILALFLLMLFRSAGVFIVAFLLAVVCVPLITFFLAYAFNNLINNQSRSMTDDLIDNYDRHHNVRFRE